MAQAVPARLNSVEGGKRRRLQSHWRSTRRIGPSAQRHVVSVNRTRMWLRVVFRAVQFCTSQFQPRKIYFGLLCTEIGPERESLRREHGERWVRRFITHFCVIKT